MRRSASEDIEHAEEVEDDDDDGGDEAGNDAVAPTSSSDPFADSHPRDLATFSKRSLQMARDFLPDCPAMLALCECMQNFQDQCTMTATKNWNLDVNTLPVEAPVIAFPRSGARGVWDVVPNVAPWNAAAPAAATLPPLGCGSLPRDLCGPANDWRTVLGTVEWRVRDGRGPRRGTFTAHNYDPAEIIESSDFDFGASSKCHLDAATSCRLSGRFGMGLKAMIAVLMQHRGEIWIDTPCKVRTFEYRPNEIDAGDAETKRHDTIYMRERSRDAQAPLRSERFVRVTLHGVSAQFDPSQCFLMLDADRTVACAWNATFVMGPFAGASSRAQSHVYNCGVRMPKPVPRMRYHVNVRIRTGVDRMQPANWAELEQCVVAAWVKAMESATGAAAQDRLYALLDRDRSFEADCVYRFHECVRGVAAGLKNAFHRKHGEEAFPMARDESLAQMARVVGWKPVVLSPRLLEVLQSTRQYRTETLKHRLEQRFRGAPAVDEQRDLPPAARRLVARVRAALQRVDPSKDLALVRSDAEVARLCPSSSESLPGGGTRALIDVGLVLGADGACKACPREAAPHAETACACIALAVLNAALRALWQEVVSNSFLSLVGALLDTNDEGAGAAAPAAAAPAAAAGPPPIPLDGVAADRAAQQPGDVENGARARKRRAAEPAPERSTREVLLSVRRELTRAERLLDRDSIEVVVPKAAPLAAQWLAAGQIVVTTDPTSVRFALPMEIDPRRLAAGPGRDADALQPLDIWVRLPGDDRAARGQQ